MMSGIHRVSDIDNATRDIASSAIRALGDPELVKKNIERAKVAIGAGKEHKTKSEALPLWVKLVSAFSNHLDWNPVGHELHNLEQVGFEGYVKHARETLNRIKKPYVNPDIGGPGESDTGQDRQNQDRENERRRIIAPALEKALAAIDANPQVAMSQAAEAKQEGFRKAWDRIIGELNAIHSKTY